MAFTNFKWFKHLIVKDFKKIKTVNQENIKLMFHLKLFTYFVECSLQVVGHGLRGVVWGVECGLRPG